MQAVEKFDAPIAGEAPSFAAVQAVEKKTKKEKFNVQPFAAVQAVEKWAAVIAPVPP